MKMNEKKLDISLPIELFNMTGKRDCGTTPRDIGAYIGYVPGTPGLRRVRRVCAGYAEYAPGTPGMRRRVCAGHAIYALSTPGMRQV